MKPGFGVGQQRHHGQKIIKLPRQMSENLAEIVGVHYGDGHMGRANHTYTISYSLGVNDNDYADYLIGLFARTLNIELNLYRDIPRNAILLHFTAKSVCDLFNKALKIPYSPKKDLHIPSYISENKKFLRRFIRGLFDTDGCVTLQRQGKYQYMLIKITTGQEAFAFEIRDALLVLGIRCFVCRKSDSFDVVVRRKESLRRFMRDIGPKNERKKRRAKALLP